MLDHICTNWRTSAAGMLIAILTAASVCSQQGVTLGNAGAGTVVGLIAALASAFLGLVARDPMSATPTTSSSSAQKLGALLLIALLVPLPVVQGCSSSQAVSEINVVLTQAVNVIAVAAPGAAWVPQMQAAVTALKNAEDTWQAGGAVTDVIDALNTIESITAVIPVTAQYSPLIDVLVAGIDVVLSSLPQAAKVTAGYTLNPHRGRAKIAHRLFRSPAADFRAAWNAAAKQAALPAAVIQ